MARIPMITRTIKATTATVVTTNISTAQASTQTIVLPRTYETKEKALKVAKKLFDNDTDKIVAVTDMSVSEHLYGMSEEMFMELAQLIEKPVPTPTTNSTAKTKNKKEK